MKKKYENIIYIFIFFFVSVLVFLSRKIQINYIKKFPEKFYVFNDPIFLNPDAYYYLTKIKKQIISNSSFLEKILSDNFLTSIYVILSKIFYDFSLPEIVFLSSPYIVFLTFLTVFLFFRSLANKEISILVSFSFILSSIFYQRSFSLFFDTDILNIFFIFLILTLFIFYLDKNLSKKNFIYYLF